MVQDWKVRPEFSGIEEFSRVREVEGKYDCLKTNTERSPAFPICKDPVLHDVSALHCAYGEKQGRGAGYLP